MKRWPLIASFVLFIALCATLAYWAMQFFKPPVRPVAAPPPSAQAPVNVDAAAGLFGGRGTTAVASNFQLKGVIMASNPKDSVVILTADGKSAQAVRAGAEILPGVRIKEVNRRFVVLSDNGVEKRVELPEQNRLAVGASAAPVATTPMRSRPAPAMPTTVVNDPAPDSQSQAPSAAASAGGTSPSTSTTPASQSTTTAETGAGANSDTGAAAGASPQSPAPDNAGTDAPTAANQGSSAGTGQATPQTAPAVPGMPVKVPPQQ